MDQLRLEAVVKQRPLNEVFEQMELEARRERVETILATRCPAIRGRDNVRYATWEELDDILACIVRVRSAYRSSDAFERVAADDKLQLTVAEGIEALR